jgi:hypothetical protein
METQAIKEIGLLDLIRIAHSMLNKTQAFLLYKYPDAISDEPDSRTYSIQFRNATISWISNIFDLCDICTIELNYQDNIEESAKKLSKFLRRTHINMWEYYGTLISRNITANSRTVFYVSKSENKLL